MKTLVRHFRPEQIRILFLIVLLIGVVAFFSIEIPGYFNARFVNRISTSVAVVAVLAVGQTLVFLTRNFDLSLGSIVGFTAYFVGQQLWHHPEIPPVAAVGLAIGVGMLMGSINGVLVAYGRVPSIITTISTLAIYRSFLVEYSHAIPITTNNLPRWIVNLSRISLLNLGEIEFRVLFVIMLAVVILFQLVLTYLPFGRRLYAIGSNPEAARIAGFPAQRMVFLAFLTSGALAGLGGFMFLGRYGNVTVLAGIGLEFSAIAAVVVGGVSNAGGSGTVVGAFLGALLLDLLENSLFRWQVISEFWRDAILGMLILAAVALDFVVFGRLKNLWARAGLELRREDDPQHETEVTSHAV
ncbi:MAG: ABC transporter permease [Anaerolineae bacterium]